MIKYSDKLFDPIMVFTKEIIEIATNNYFVNQAKHKQEMLSNLCLLYEKSAASLSIDADHLLELQKFINLFSNNGPQSRESQREWSASEIFIINDNKRFYSTGRAKKAINKMEKTLTQQSFKAKLHALWHRLVQLMRVRK